jgi:light-regulated signal transduction histidine kinase (bacteriophytochrome)
VGEREDVASVVAHDLSEPLRVIAHFAARLERKPDGDRAEASVGECVEGILGAVERMRALLDSLREYGRAGAQRLERHPTDTDAVLDQALANLKVALEESDARVTRDRLPTFETDGVQLVRVFQNLIDNAVKFRAERAPEIHVSASRDADGYTFSVRDNGVGFDARSAERIFWLFERAHPHHDYAGTGTGLAICARIVEQHGGRIWAASRPGSGSSFYFTLPDA